jgi:hypothetical protein
MIKNFGIMLGRTIERRDRKGLGSMRYSSLSFALFFALCASLIPLWLLFCGITLGHDALLGMLI